MSTLHFSKFNGAGNDFIMAVDSAENPCPQSISDIVRLCDRRRGIGADGVIWLKSQTDGRIRFQYRNSDGSFAGMCGNGLRCAMEFAALNGLVSGNRAEFQTDSGVLSAERISPGIIRIRMPEPVPFKEYDIQGHHCYATDTGVPHVIVETLQLADFDVNGIGRTLRYADVFAPDGANIDFVKVLSADEAQVRTYERGVENETLACGTGVAAVGAFLTKYRGGGTKKTIHCHGGDTLSVEIMGDDGPLKMIYLTGPADLSFTGTVQYKTENP